MANRKVLRSWRVTEASPSGAYVWFDPSRETIRLYELEPPPDRGVAIACEGGDQADLFETDQEKSVSRSLDTDLPF